MLFHVFFLYFLVVDLLFVSDLWVNLQSCVLVLMLYYSKNKMLYMCLNIEWTKLRFTINEYNMFHEHKHTEYLQLKQIMNLIELKVSKWLKSPRLLCSQLRKVEMHNVVGSGRSSIGLNPIFFTSIWFFFKTLMLITIKLENLERSLNAYSLSNFPWILYIWLTRGKVSVNTSTRIFYLKKVLQPINIWLELTSRNYYI